MAKTRRIKWRTSRARRASAGLRAAAGRTTRVSRQLPVAPAPAAMGPLPLAGSAASARTGVAGHWKTMLLSTVSAGAIALAVPALFAAPAHAQALPPECAGGTGMMGDAVNGDTIMCIVAPPATIGGISTNVNDLTLNIGAPGMPTIVDGGIGISMAGDGPQTLNIFDAGSSVTGTSDGVNIQVTGGPGNLTVVSEGTVTGGADGIDASNSGSGALSITAADVTGTSGDGILAFSFGTDLTITTTGTVTGGDYGAYATNIGTGALTITTSGTVMGALDGILASNSSAGTDLTITATGTVTGGTDGIDAENVGTGNLSITANSMVIGNDQGIVADHNGTGALTIMAADVTGTNSNGIEAFHSGTGDVTITASGTVMGGDDGIDAEHDTMGVLTITTTGMVVGEGDAGIEANHDGTGNLTITASDMVMGNNQGIVGDHSGVGELVIVATDVTGMTSDGIQTEHSDDGGITITASGTVTGSDDGIEAVHSGTGDVAITTTGTVTGGLYGIDADHNGTGALTIMAADVTGTTFNGIEATNGTYATDLTITTTGTVTGGDNGIDALNFGTGALSITAADVTATDDGIFANHFGTDLAITTTGTVTGGTTGIDAINGGSGALSITAADVTGTSGNGIEAANGTYATDLTITTTGTVTGNFTGIDAYNDGSGALTITAAVVRGSAPGASAIEAANGTYATDLTITTTGTVTGNGGIDAINRGSGALSITAADVAGTSNPGIEARNNNSGTDLTITTTGTVTGTGTGIYANNDGSGALSITAADVTGTSFAGIDAENDGTDLTITTTGTVTGITFGIYADNDGSGALSITAADVTATDDGIRAVNNLVGTDLSITTTGTVTGGDNGINAGNIGTGALTITAADVTATLGAGIRAYNFFGTDLSITTTGTVTGGDYGIFANNYATGDITITTSGTVTGGTFGIAANQNGSGALSITSTGAVTGGSGAGIGFLGPELTIAGDVVVSAASGTAIAFGGYYAPPTTTLNNAGILTTVGAVDLTAGLGGAFNNLAGAVFNAGTSVSLGAGYAFTNAGTLSPGGADVVATTSITGDFVQTASGALLVTVDGAAGTADLVDITGTATLDGLIEVNALSVAPGEQAFTILSAAGGVTDAGVLLSSPVLLAELVFPNPNDVVLETTLDFAAPDAGLNRNQTNVSEALNEVAAAGGGGLTPILDAIVNEVTSDEELALAYDQLSGETVGTLQTTTLFNAHNFANNLMICKQREGTFTAIAEGQCYWLQPQGRRVNRDSTSQNVGVTESVGGIALGVQFSVAPNWFVGGGFSYEGGTFDTDSGTDGTIDRYQGGAVVKYQKDALLVAGSVSGGTSQIDQTRNVNFGGLALAAHSNPDVGFVGAQMRAAYLLESGAWSFKPTVDLNVTYVSRDRERETRADGANLIIGGDDNTVFSGAPSVEISRDYAFESGMKIRPFVDLGLTVFANTEQTFTTQFADAPDGTGGFVVETELDTVFGDVDAGATLFSQGNYDLTLRYQGRFAGNTTIHGGQFRASVKF